MRPARKKTTSINIPLQYAPLFPLGTVFATPEVLEAIESAGQSPLYFLSRHSIGDWSETDPRNAALNVTALASNEKIFSVYETKLTESIYVVTEGDRSSTNLVLASEY